MINIAVFVSGSGTNCENLIRHFANSQTARVKLVVSNRSDAPAVSKSQRLGIDTCIISKKELNDAVSTLTLLRNQQIDFIVLAGFLLMIPPYLVDAYEHRMINLHPALLPKFGGPGMYGRHVHEAVKAAGESMTGFTVHWVSAVCDAGDIIAQRTVSLTPTDTVDDIMHKEHMLEMSFFPQIVEDVIKELRLSK